MLLKCVIIASIAILEIADSYPIIVKGKPVDLVYNCIHPKNANVEEQDKSSVLLLHGLGSSRRHWDGVVEVIAVRTGRRVCAVDLRNHGDSPWSDKTDIATMAGDIKLFLEKQNITKVNIIGHSLGGKVGVEFTLDNPDKVDSLVVEDMRPNGITAFGLTVVKMFVQALQDAIKEAEPHYTEEQAKTAIIDFLTRTLQKYDREAKISDSDANSLQIRFVNNEWQYKMNLKVLIKLLKNHKEVLVPSAGLYEGPTMFIYGQESYFNVGGAEKNIRELFPKAKLVPVKGAGHSIHGRFRQFDDEVVKFLNEIK